MSVFDLMQELDISDPNWVTMTLLEIIDTIQSAIFAGGIILYDLMLDFIQNVTQIDTRLTNYGEIILFTTNLATVILAILFLKQIFTNYVLNIDGEADVDPLQSLLNIAFALATINCGEELYKIAYRATELVQNGLRDSIIAAGMPSATTFSDWIQNSLIVIAETLIYVAPSAIGGGAVTLCLALIAIIWICILIVMIIVLLCKMVFRSAELFIFRILWPLFSCNLITPSKELWRPYISMYLTTLFGFLLQYLCLMLTITLICNTAYISSADYDLKILWNPVLATAFLYFACKAPKWLQKFTYTTGAGQTVGNGTRGMVGAVSSLLGRFIR